MPAGSHPHAQYVYPTTGHSSWLIPPRSGHLFTLVPSPCPTHHRDPPAPLTGTAEQRQRVVLCVGPVSPACPALEGCCFPFVAEEEQT